MYGANIVNISANGFAFVTDEQDFEDAKGKYLELTIHNFKLLERCVLKGCVIRTTNDESKCIIGCRMPEDNIAILNYVNKNYKD